MDQKIPVEFIEEAGGFSKGELADIVGFIQVHDQVRAVCVNSQMFGDVKLNQIKPWSYEPAANTPATKRTYVREEDVVDDMAELEQLIADGWIPRHVQNECLETGENERFISVGFQRPIEGKRGSEKRSEHVIISLDDLKKFDSKYKPKQVSEVEFKKIY